jgi:twitching motility protein PilT
VLLHILAQAVDAGASDVFLSSGKAPRMRLHGTIQALDPSITTESHILGLVPAEAGHEELDRTGSVDFGSSWPLSGRKRRLRVNVFRHAGGLAAAIRPIRDRIPSLDELQLSSSLLELCAYPSGLVLLTGASGSGKSTTLAALVEHINRTKARHIITIEDPIEFEHHEHQSLIHQREVGTTVESFSTGLRAALRENPDVILLGEMRDLPTISAALTAAETGHLVLSTLHTGSATAAVNRIIDVFPGHQQAHVRIQLASSLRAVVSQRLIRTAGRTGRVPAIEKLVVNPAIANAIRDGHEHHMKSTMQTGAEAGMITLERSLATLVCRGTITRDDAFRHADDPRALEKLLE